MTFYVENESDFELDLKVDEVAEKVIKEVLRFEKCPYEVEINLLITDLYGIKEYNHIYREIDRETDVLSFPAVDYDEPSNFSYVEANPECYLNPETQELILGDIIVCAQKADMQAKEYGHSQLREFAFLITHSMLHLLGYDHMEEEEERVMFQKQDEILDNLGITR